MDTTITLDEPHFKKLSGKAQALGTTPEQYVQTLIDADSRTFDEILQPVRDGFAAMSEDELDALFQRARDASRRAD